MSSRYSLPTVDVAEAKGASRAVFILALSQPVAEELSRQAQSVDYRTWILSDLAEVSSLAEQVRPDIAIVNLDKPGANDLLSNLGLVLRGAAIAGVTKAPVLVRVAEAIRMGASTVVASPTTFGQIEAALNVRGAPHVGATHMSLDRAIWEFLNQALLEAGSISEAARRVSLDRTSFKRMLRKGPPPR